MEAAKGVAVAKLGVAADAVQVLSAETQVVAGARPCISQLRLAGLVLREVRTAGQQQELAAHGLAAAA